MKIATLIGICTLATAAYGCSGGSGNGGGNTGLNTGSGSSDQTPVENSGSTAAQSGDTSASGSVAASGSETQTTGSTTTSGSTSGTTAPSSGTAVATTGTADDDSGAGSGSPATGSGTSTATSGTSGDSPGTGIQTVLTMDNPETDYSGKKTVQMAPFNVPANTEVFYCQTFANPWGAQTDIKTYDLTMNPGSHHMFAFYKSGATTETTASACAAGGLTYGAFTFVSQTPTSTITFPPTVGATLPASMGFNIMVHYLNTGSSAITANVKLDMYPAKSGVVTNHAGVIFMNNAAMSVPATGQPYDSTANMTLSQDVNIMLSSSHMHKFGTNFVYTATPPGGQKQMIYTSTQWDEPKPVVFSTPLTFPSGTQYTWTCTDVNNTGKTLTFGEYAQTNVMCIAVSIFYPVNPSSLSNPTLGSPIGGF